MLSFEGAWEEKNLEIETSVEEEVFVDTDGQLLSLVWNNLFSNAIKFTEDNGKITLPDHGGRKCGCAGIGYRLWHSTRSRTTYFLKNFYQGDTSHATQGNGLGLALVKRVMDIVGGDISVSSQVGKGSTFTVKIRRKQNGEA